MYGMQNNVKRYHWPRDTAKRLKKLMKAGLTQAEAAATFEPDKNGVQPSANSLGSKVDYLGFTWSKPKPRKKANKVKRAKDGMDTRVSFAYSKPLPIPDEPSELTTFNNSIPLDQRKTLLELNGFTCRWPVGEPAQPGFFYCGAECALDTPYCAAHRAFALRG